MASLEILCFKFKHFKLTEHNLDSVSLISGIFYKSFDNRESLDNDFLHFKLSAFIGFLVGKSLRISEEELF